MELRNEDKPRQARYNFPGVECREAYKAVGDGVAVKGLDGSAGGDVPALPLTQHNGINLEY